MFTERQYRLPRKWSNKILKTVAPLFTGNVINISAWKDQDKEGGFYSDYFINADSYIISNYSGERGSQGLPLSRGSTDAGARALRIKWANDGDFNKGEFFLDLTAELDNKYIDKFDVCFNHTTLEHIYNVNKAFSTICKMTKDIAIVVVPFSQTQHEAGNIRDYWRFTPTCLRKLFRVNNMDVIFEAINDHNNAGIYLFFVGSKNSKKWIGKMPNYNSLNSVGQNLGLIKRILKRNN